MRFLGLLSILLLAACTTSAPYDPTIASVKITNLQQNSGGSGVVIWSSPTRSTVLTNAHVCGLAVKGALVHSKAIGSTAVVSYKLYDKHDLCLITVFADLKVRTELAESPPAIGDRLMVSGYPQLLPNSQVFGRYNGKLMIPVMIGMRSCTDEDRANPDSAMFCAFFGMVPSVKIYEVMALSALISPGNSGSPVYNADFKLIGLIFAASGEVGWGMAVPYEFLHDFIDQDSKHPFDNVLYPNTVQ